MKPKRTPMKHEGVPEECSFPSVAAVAGCQACPLVQACPASEAGRVPKSTSPGCITRDGRLSANRAIPAPPSAGMANTVRTPRIPPTIGSKDAPLPPPTHLGPRQSVIVMDRSGSMGTDDYPPNRLAAAKNAARTYVETRAALSPADLVGVVAFGTRARILCGPEPLGTAKDTVLTAIENIELGIKTSIGAGLAKAEELLLGSHGSWFGKLLGRDVPHALPSSGWLQHAILLTDGEQNRDPEPLPIAKRLKQAGVLIDCIGIGDRKEIDEKLLRQIASVQDRRTRYRFVADLDELLGQYRQLGGFLTR